MKLSEELTAERTRAREMIAKWTGDKQTLTRAPYVGDRQYDRHRQICDYLVNAGRNVDAACTQMIGELQRLPDPVV